MQCLLCEGEMRIELGHLESWWQCRKDQTHRMGLDEESDLRHEERTRVEIIDVMQNRQAGLQTQLDELSEGRILEKL